MPNKLKLHTSTHSACLLKDLFLKEVTCCASLLEQTISELKFVAQSQLSYTTPVLSFAVCSIQSSQIILTNPLGGRTHRDGNGKEEILISERLSCHLCKRTRGSLVNCLHLVITTEKPGNQKRDSYTIHQKTDITTRMLPQSSGYRGKHWHYLTFQLTRRIWKSRSIKEGRKNKKKTDSQVDSGSTITFPMKYSAIPQTLQFYLNRQFLKLARKPTKFTQGEIKVPRSSSHKVS